MLAKKKLIRWIILNIIMAIAFIFAMEISHRFTSIPGQIASISLPSAITLAMILRYKNKVLAGIVIGSIIGLTPSLIDLYPNLSFSELIIIQVVFSTTHLLQPLLISYLLDKFGKNQPIFAHLYSVWVFIVSAMFAPLISAVMINTTLLYLNIINLDQYPLYFSTWWLANTVAHLIFTPSIIIYQEKDILRRSANFWEITLVLLLLFLNNILIFQYSYRVEYLPLLVLIWGVFRLSRFHSSLLIILISLITIIPTIYGYGIFIDKNLQESSLFLQSFNAVLSITTLILTAILSEKEEAQLYLKQTLDNLEITIQERTKELQKTQVHLEEVNQSLSQMVDTDGLTLIANRRCFDRILAEQWYKLCLTKQYLSILLVDVDYFKLYNDAYGHPLGDECLKKVAQALKKSSNRSSDLVARYGGEEFIILLCDTNISGAIVVAQRIQSSIKDLQITHQKSLIAPIVTVSIGISSVIPSPNITSEELVNQADKALYLSKKKGRNQYNTFPQKNATI